MPRVWHLDQIPGQSQAIQGPPQDPSDRPTEDMLEKYARTKMDENIQTIRKAALELREASGTMQAVDLNADGILASVKMLDIGVSDAIEIWE